MKTMLAAVAEKPGVLAVREVPMPEIEETECLVEILACGICNSTDRKLLDGHFRNRGPEVYPGILGHESVGRVIECGRAVTSFRVGDLVLRPGASYPPGQGPSSLFGGLAQFGKVKDPAHGGNRMHQIVPPEIDPLDATMLITLKETLSWLQRWLPSSPLPGGTGILPVSLAVLGTGPVGLSFAYFARMLGCYPVVVVGRREEALRRAQQFGLDGILNTDAATMTRDLTGGKGADRVIEAIGSDEALHLGLSLLSPQGRLGVYGIASTREAGDMERRAIDLGLARNEWAIEFFNPQEWAPHEQLLWLVKQGMVKLRDWYTHVVPLEETQRGFELLEGKEAFKVVVQIGRCHSCE
ncbi:MAG: zinc-dependent alcohol dehydrogenase [Armatimonadota bacterium]